MRGTGAASRPQHALARQFISFAIVGTVGFVVDVGILSLCLQARLGYYLGRLVSFLTVATLTWYGNRIYTFRHAARDQPGGRQWMRFVAAMSTGGAVNYGVYSALIAGAELFRAHPALAVAAGSIAGLAVNFSASRRLVFGTMPCGSGPNRTGQHARDQSLRCNTPAAGESR
jgi:putative flippase GtrA